MNQVNKIAMFLLVGGLLCGAMVISGCNDQVGDLTIESAALIIGYDMRGNFQWDDKSLKYYDAIMEGKMSLDGAKAVEDYFSRKYPSLIVNRVMRLAGMVGFDLDAAGKIIGVDRVNIHLLQVAAQGFRQGLLLK